MLGNVLKCACILRDVSNLHVKHVNMYDVEGLGLVILIVVAFALLKNLDINRYNHYTEQFSKCTI